MTAQSIGIFTIDFSDPHAIGYNDDRLNTLNSTVGFQDRISGSIQTLSTKDVDATTSIYGLLYVPELRSDTCRSIEQNHVPSNVTRLRNLPAGKEYAFVALAPWYNATCMTEYFAAARQTSTKAAIVYQLGQSNAKPPVLNDPSWALDDGGAWQMANTFPTYAVPPAVGSVIMAQLNKYSANLSDVPNGQRLATVYNTTDYVRLWASVNTGTSNQLPSLWTFLIIVISILLIAVTTVSVAMHVIQRRRRRALHQRVVNGEVDLEALGVKRLSVPQQILDQLPMYTYTAVDHKMREKTSSDIPNTTVDQSSLDANTEEDMKESSVARPLSESTMPTNSIPAPWSQPICSICLDDFVVNESNVRELPCHHVFHPNCIDLFLLRNSSLCPLCKQSVLPKGRCPVAITNAMVRRERYITRLRTRGRNARNASQNATASMVLGNATWHSRLIRRLSGLVYRTHTPVPSSQIHLGASDVEMANANTGGTALSQESVALAATSHNTHDDVPQLSALTEPASAQNCESMQSRREWTGQRVAASLSHQNTLLGDVDDEEQRESKWKRAFRKVFPGFG